MRSYVDSIYDETRAGCNRMCRQASTSELCVKHQWTSLKAMHVLPSSKFECMHICAELQ